MAQQEAIPDQTPKPAGVVAGNFPKTASGRRARLIRLRSELTVTTEAISALCRELLTDAEHLPADFVTGARQIERTCGELQEFVLRRLAPAAFEGEGAVPFDDSTFENIRHAAINKTAAIGYLCDELIEEDSQRFAPLAETLGELKSLYQSLLSKLRRDCRLEPKDILGTLKSGSGSTAARPVSVAEAPGTILVVDDDEFSRARLTKLLSAQGHSVISAKNGSEALEQLAHHAFDLVLLDIHMDEMNGHELLDKIRHRTNWKKIPVVMVSATGDVENIAQCIEAGAEDYLPKPIEPRLLEARVNYCLSRRRALQHEETLRAELKREGERAKEVLGDLFPRHMVGSLLNRRGITPRWQPNVAVMFSDVVGFTKYCDGRDPDEIVSKVGVLFEAFEQIADKYKVDKIKTIGDCFMCTSGLFEYSGENPVLDCVRCAVEMHDAAWKNCGWKIRIGINFGAAVVGVVGKRRYAFDLWGDAVNTAARAQTSAEAGTTYLSADAWRQIDHLATADETGPMSVKNKGPMSFYRFIELLPAQ